MDSRYYRDSKVAIRVESTKTGGERNINDHVTLVLISYSRFQRIKRKENENKKKKDREEDDKSKEEKIIKL